jgi:hypothetical protein
MVRRFRPASARPILRWRWGAKRSCTSGTRRGSIPHVAWGAIPDVA